MTTTERDRVPTEWSDERDVAFFRITSRVFPPAFLAGASALLASYDPADEPPATSGCPWQGEPTPDAARQLPGLLRRQPNPVQRRQSCSWGRFV